MDKDNYYNDRDSGYSKGYSRYENRSDSSSSEYDKDSVNDIHFAEVWSAVEKWLLNHKQLIGLTMVILAVCVSVFCACVYCIKNADLIAEEVHSWITPSNEGVAENEEIPASLDSQQMEDKTETVVPVEERLNREGAANAAERESKRDIDKVERADRPEGIKKPNVARESVNTKEDMRIYLVVQQMPRYPGGNGNLMKYIHDNMSIKAEDDVLANTLVSFVVEKDGSLTNIKAERPSNPRLDEEAIRIVSSMGKWIPGMENGKPVRVKYVVPVGYRLY